MKSTAFQTIEKQLPLLSQEEQLLLIEQLAQRLRQSKPALDLQAAIAAMASDPQIQEELRQIEAELS